MLIRDSAGLAGVCRDLRAHGSFALDTEFIRERTYSPRLCLVQVAVPALCTAIDPLAGVDLDPLIELIFDPSIEKIVHAGWQDFEIFYARTGRVPESVFDTQIAAALAGVGEQVGYANLLDRALGISLGKVETYTDWSRRPLSPSQIEYALDDVRYLLPLWAKLTRMLEDLGRIEWLRDESRRYRDPAAYERDPRSQCLRLRGARHLPPVSLAVLQELAVWREEAAAERDVPRGRIVADEILVEIAKRCPRSISDLRPIRNFHPKVLERGGQKLLAAVARGLALPPERWPTLSKSRTDEPERALLADFLEAVVRLRAHDARIAPGYLATRAQINELVDAGLEGRSPEDPETGSAPAVLSGWRRGLVGEDLLRALAGETDLGIDPEKGTLVLKTREP